MSDIRRIIDTTRGVVASEEFQRFRISAADFLSAQDHSAASGTRIEQMTATLDDAAELVNRSFGKREGGQYTNVISPVVVPKDHRSYLWVAVTIALAVLGLFGSFSTALVDRALGFSNLAQTLFGPHYWLLLLAYVAFNLWRNSYVMVPDGCQALITRFGKVEQVVGAGRTVLFDPWKRVSYIVNTTREYPYNAPIREAPTAGRVNASVDLFLQFRIEDPASFIFTLGGAKGFQEKLLNAISEVTRALIYEQKAEAIYDLVGETTQPLLDSLNQQFAPAVRFVNANITHAEPSSQEYRMNLAAPEMVRVAKEAYSYQYQLTLRKEQDEGDLNRELAALHETLSGILAESATYQAQIDTALEKETNRANAYASQLLSEAESAAKANAALLEAQALDIRAVGAASYPDILQYRFQQELLEHLAAVADHLPLLVQVGGDGQPIDYLATARALLGVNDETLYSEDDVRAIRARAQAIQERIRARGEQLARLDVQAATNNGGEV